MRKKVLSVVVVLVVLVAGYVIYNFLSIPTAEKDAKMFSAVPTNAAFVINSKNPFETWQDFKETQLGKSILTLSSLDNIDKEFFFYDSLQQKSSAIKNFLSEHELLIVGQMNGASSYGLIFICEGNAAQYSGLLNEVKSLFSKSKSSSRNYDEVAIDDFVFQNGQKLSLCFLGGNILASASPILIEDAIKQQKYGVALTQNKSFKKLRKTSDIKSGGAVFINFPEFGKLLSLNTNEENAQIAKRFEHFGSWMELDLDVKQSGVMMNGFSIINDSLPSFMHTFKGEKPDGHLVASILPNNTAYFMNLNIGSFKSYNEKLEQYLNHKNEAARRKKNIANINKKYGFSIEKDLFDWFGKSLTLFITEGKQKNPNENLGAIIKASDIELGIKALKKIQAKTNSNNKPVVYRNYEIKDLGLTNLFPLILGDFFKGVEKSHYTIIEDYVVFANSESNLKHVINSYLRGKTLIKSVAFNNFCSKLQDNDNLFIYSNIRFSKNFWPYYLEKELSKQIKANKDSLEGIESFGYQLIAGSEMYLSNAYFNYNKAEKNQAISLIETKLDTTFNIKPWVVKNHRTNKKELLLQDANNKLYLINNVGKILWTKQLNEKIIGHVTQIDRYRNKKLQYLFGTKNKMHLVDRNGKNVEGYPVKLKNNLTAGIQVLDYDKNRKYRILVPCGKQLYNYSKEGKIVKGWEFKGMPANITTPPVLFQKKKKDYVVVVDQLGHVKVLNRKGEERIILNSKLPKGKSYYIVKGKSLSTTGVFTSDSTGTLYFQKLTDDIDAVAFKAFSPKHNLYVGDIDEDGVTDATFYDENTIYSYKLSKKKLLEITDVAANPAEQLNIFNLSRGNSVLAFSLSQTGKVYVYDSKGNLFENFPLEGVTPMLVNDLNLDGRFDVIVGDKHGSLYFYSLF